MAEHHPANAERQRLAQARDRQLNWKRWGPYLSERQWATVREDYSADGATWDYFPHEHARSRAYRWGEDGLLGWCDREARLCFALALWNGNDPILKERLFGLSNPQGNHGEDVKEHYFYLDASPTYAYTKALYKYPQGRFPYEKLVEENARRSKDQPEYELQDTGIFDESRYFDIVAEYAKASPNDILVKITAYNRGPDAAPLNILPTLWFRNTWSWGKDDDEAKWGKPRMHLEDGRLAIHHASLGRFDCEVSPASDGSEPRWIFTDNETNTERLFGTPNVNPYTKDAFHHYVIHGEKDRVNPESVGTKAAAHFTLDIPAGGQVTLKLRFYAENEAPKSSAFDNFDAVFVQKQAENDALHDSFSRTSVTPEQSQILRQAHAGLLWSKQFYHYVIDEWIEGDTDQPPPPPARAHGRNADWSHLFNRDVISMPDKWEYPWYAAWDLAFHMLPMARLDPDFAKAQLVMMLREWYMHPNGQIPAYEFNFCDVNPPVHAWACWRVYKMTGPRGQRDRLFLERTFQKLLLNFTFWVNRKDHDGNHIFAGGFLGLDNIGVFDRSRPILDDARLEQADGTAWMAFYCGTMLSMALELAEPGNAYEDLASKFFEHYVHIADAINCFAGTGLWDERDGFYYDQMHYDGQCTRLRIRSLVGLIPMIAAEVIERDAVERLPGFYKRARWFVEHRPDLAKQISYLETEERGHSHFLLAIPNRQRLERLLGYLLSEAEFLSPFGIRSLSRYHQDHPFTLSLDGQTHRVDYEPGEASSGMFGGNSNWRGPVWFPINYLIIEALERYHHFYGNNLKVECPIGSGNQMNLAQVANELRSRLMRLFVADDAGGRPIFAGDPRFARDPHWRDLLLFHEYFHADTGQGLGASHQTGWTSLVTQCILDPSGSSAHPDWSLK